MKKTAFRLLSALFFITIFFTSTSLVHAAIPGTISTLSIASEDGQVRLFWTAPSATPAVADYVIQYREYGASAWNTFADGISTATTAVVTGLSNRVRYEFNVKAVNADGTGAQSNLQNTIPLGIVFQDTFESYTVGSNISGQGGWQSGGDSTWTTQSGNGGKVVGPSTNGTHFIKNNIQNGTSAYTNSRIAVDFKYTGSGYAIPQLWLRKTAQTGDAGGYLLYQETGAKQFYLSKYSANANGNLSWAAQAAAPIATLTTNTFYRVEFEAINTSTGGVQLKGYLYPVGGVKTKPFITWTDTSSVYAGGYFGIGRYAAQPISYDNVQVYDYSAYNTPSEPRTLAAASGVSGATLSWTSPQYTGTSAITDYIVEYKPTSSSTWLIFTDGVSIATTTAVTGLTDGTSYNFRVRALNASGAGTISATATATPSNPQPPTVSNVSISGTAQVGQTVTGLYVYTDPNGDAQGTSTFRWLTSSTQNGTYVPIAGATHTTYVIQTADESQYFKFEVTPVTTVTPTTGSPIVSASVVIATQPAAPSAPQNLSATAGDAQVSLAWTLPVSQGSSSITDYRIEYKQTSSNTWSVFADGASVNLSTKVTGLANATSYDFRVSAINTAGTGAASTIMSVIPSAPLSATKVYRIDFGGTGSLSGPNWNNITSTTQSLLSLVDTGGLSSPINFQFTDSFFSGSFNGNGTHSSTLYPATATQDSFFLGSLGGAPDNTAAIRLSGLTGANYAFRFYASRVAGDTSDRTTIYSVGGSSYELNATNNVNNSIQSAFVVPTAGIINIAIEKKSTAAYGYLGVLEITETVGEVQAQTPTASNVSISGAAQVGKTLTGSYTYSDPNSDPEGSSTFRWLRASTSGGSYSAISGATNSTYVLQAGDLDQYIKFEVTPVATVAPTVGAVTTSLSAGPVITNVPTTYLHIFSTGQSLSTGYSSTGALTTTQPYNNLMLTNGVEATSTPLIALRESGNGENSNVETPSSAMANTIRAGDLQQQPIIVSLHGHNGAAYSEIKKGTSYYARGITQATNAKNYITNTLTGIYKPSAVMITHGETDYDNGVSAATYEGYLNELQNDYQTDLNALAGTNGTIPLFVNQMNTGLDGRIAVSQLSTHKNNSGKIILVGPKYQMAYTGDGVHLINSGSKYLGELMGKVMKKVLIDGQTWNPLMPTTIARTNNIVTVSFNIPTGTLAFDTTNVALRPNYGFEFAQTGGNAVSISNVQLINNNTQAQITLSGVPTGTNQRLRYAYTCSGNHGGTYIFVCGKANDGTYVGGNVRDTDTSTSQAPGSTGLPLYDWLVAFDEPIQ